MHISPNKQESYLAAAISCLSESHFPESLNDWLQTCLSYDNITILAYFPSQQPKSFLFKNREPRVHENMTQIYLAGAYLLDPFHNLHVNKVDSGVYRLSDIAPDRFSRNQYFLEYYRNTTIVDEIAFVSYPSPDVSLHVCLARDSSSKKRFSTRMMADAYKIAPIVASLTNQHWKGLTSDKESAKGKIVTNLLLSIDRIHGISLSPRQAEVAMLVLQGHSSVSIGLILGISSQTVKVFRKQLYRKCKISSQAELFSLMLPILEALSGS